MQQKLTQGSINLVLTGSRKAVRDKKRPSLEKKIIPAVHAVAEERKCSTGGAQDYIHREIECRIYCNWDKIMPSSTKSFNYCRITVAGSCVPCEASVKYLTVWTVQFLSPRPNWDPPPPLPQVNVALLRNQRGGGWCTHSPAGEGDGGGGPNWDDWRKSLAFCLLCAMCIWMFIDHFPYV